MSNRFKSGDVCRVCGDEIPDNAGSLDYRCDACVREGRQVPADRSKWFTKLLTERNPSMPTNFVHSSDGFNADPDGPEVAALNAELRPLGLTMQPTISGAPVIYPSTDRGGPIRWIAAVASLSALSN